MKYYTKWLLTPLAAAALTLSACGGSPEEERPMESSVHEFDAQTSEAEAAAEIAEANSPMISDREDNPISPSRDEPEGSGAVIGEQATPDTDITGGVGSTMNTDTPDNYTDTSTGDTLDNSLEPDVETVEDAETATNY